MIFLEYVGSRACLSAKGADKISQSETKAFKFINVKAFFLFPALICMDDNAESGEYKR